MTILLISRGFLSLRRVGLRQRKYLLSQQLSVLPNKLYVCPEDGVWAAF